MKAGMDALIMAGGSGTRFWPASREHLPKQFLRITGERTMLHETISRLETLIDPARVSVVVGRLHERVTEDLLTGTPTRVIVEPFGRNTAACIGLAAIHLRRNDPDSLMVVLPADHYIADRERFLRLLESAGEVARSGAIVTLGIVPTRPETGYGYIKLGAESREADGIVCTTVDRFVEKPNLETAIGYLTSGGYLWNSGIFLFTAEAILAEIEAHLPDLARGLAEIEAAIGRSDYQEVLERVYATLPSISIDHGIIEKTVRPLYVFRADMGWSDVGSWQALYELRRGETGSSDDAGNLLLGRAWAEDSRDNLVYSTSGRRIALLGVEGLAIVDTDDVLMVADISRSQDVKRFTEREKAEKRSPGS